MILLVDAGNSRIKWACLKGGAIVASGACATRSVEQLREGCALTQVKRAIVSWVAGEAPREALSAMFSKAGIPVDWVRAQAEAHGLRNHYQPPESLGVDRFVALIGAHRRLRRDCLVVNVGTALTVDLLTQDGEFLGGCIAPGPDLMRESLLSGTAGIGFVQGGWQAVPLDTGAAVDTGITLALLGVVRGMRDQLGNLTGMAEGCPPPLVVLGGGARHWLSGHVPGEVFESEELVLEGLTWIARDLGCAD